MNNRASFVNVSCAQCAECYLVDANITKYGEYAGGREQTFHRLLGENFVK